MPEERTYPAPSEADLANEPKIRHALGVLALARTVFSSERSVMSWMRTSVSLYAFGFSITKFIAYLEGQQPGDQFPNGARQLGGLLILTALAALVVAVIEHTRRLRIMEGKGLPRLRRVSLPILGALALFIVGVLALINLATSG